MKSKFKLFLVLLTSFLIINVISYGEKELTPRKLAYKAFFLLPKNLTQLFLGKAANLSKPIAEITLSKEKLKKEKLYYQGEEFEVWIDPSIELNQEKIKFLYHYYLYTRGVK